MRPLSAAGGRKPRAEARTKAARSVELAITAVAVGGDGVAREESGRVVFVPRTAPGDHVRAAVVEERGSYARAVCLKLLRRGPERCEPPCGHYEGCGGCQLQHLEIGAQRRWKRRFVSDTLRRLGGLAIEVPPLRSGATAWGYRNRITLLLKRRGRQVVAGYRSWRDPATVIDILGCPLAEEPVRTAWAALRAAWEDGARSLPGGSELRVTLRASVAGEIGLYVRGGRAGEPGSPECLEAAIPNLASYVWKDDQGTEHTLAGRPFLVDRWQDLEFELAPEVFLQVNREVSALIDAELDALAGERRGRPVADLYAGVGARALRWARQGAELIACERDPRACESGRRAARVHGIDVRYVEADVEKYLRSFECRGLVVVNPPRRGMTRQAVRLLAGQPAEALLYVSCDPATLARDARRLVDGGWRLSSVQPFDVFPQTAHVECVARFERSGGTRGRSES